MRARSVPGTLYPEPNIKRDAKQSRQISIGVNLFSVLSRFTIFENGAAVLVKHYVTRVTGLMKRSQRSWPTGRKEGLDYIADNYRTVISKRRAVVKEI